MKPQINIFGLLLLLTVEQLAFGQKQDTIYYDREWRATSPNKAAFYRIVTYDHNGAPVGRVTDFFITGELQGEGEALTIDKSDDSKSKWKGKTIGYYKSGRRRFERNSDTLGNVNGTSTNWYENGKLERKAEFKNGKIVGKWSTECDEFEKCQRVFWETFSSQDDDNGWEPADLEDIKSEIVAGEGLLMETKTEKGYAEWIHLPIDVTKNFSIETAMDFRGGEENTPHGLIYGYKDWNDYFYFCISADGYYRIGAVSDGLNLEYAKWTESRFINKNIDRNVIKVNKVQDKVYFSINGQIVETEEFYSFRGNNIGFYVPTGQKKVLFKGLHISQDIGLEEALSKLPFTSKWKASGTGFFIDAKGYIVTNYHVIENSLEIEIDLLQNGQKHSYKAKVISSDKQNDLTIINIEDVNFRPYSKLPYNFKTQISDVGSSVFALGYPLALSSMGDEVKFTDGKISSKTGFQGDITTYQISVPVQPGSSGGPLFDYDGNIIGVVNAKIMAADNVSYAIKSTYLKNLLDVLPEVLDIPNDKTLLSKSLTDKIKLLSDYIVLVKVK